MSSIYRKNRDGYFYYQAYVYNPKSKKKDKRIFHALATKNEEEAKIKQAYYDKKYKNISKNKPSGLFKKYVLKNKKTFLAVGVSSFFTFLITQNFNNTPKDIVYNSDNIQLESVIIEKIEEDYNQEKDGRPELTKDKFIENKKKLQKPEQEAVKVEYIKNPQYKIIRKEQLSEAFDQWKLFVVVDSDLDSKNLRKICNKILKKHSNYQNLVICIYLNNDVGMKIALGVKEGFSLEQEKDSWLAMFTYNSVEGAFFDDNPGQYIWQN